MAGNTVYTIPYYIGQMCIRDRYYGCLAETVSYSSLAKIHMCLLQNKVTCSTNPHPIIQLVGTENIRSDFFKIWSCIVLIYPSVLLCTVIFLTNDHCSVHIILGDIWSCNSLVQSHICVTCSFKLIGIFKP